MNRRDVIGEFLEELGVDQAYRAADVLIGRLVRPTVKQEGTTGTQCTVFTGDNDADILVRVAAFIGAESDRVLLGLWSTGFGEPNEFCYQVIHE